MDVEKTKENGKTALIIMTALFVFMASGGALYNGTHPLIVGAALLIFSLVMAMPVARMNVLWIGIGLFFVFAGVALSALYLWVPYSYWLDELGSVAVSKQNLTAMHEIILADTHPPLYQILLSGWIALFGDSEPATRSLSWLFAMAGLGAVVFYERRSAVVFFVTLILFIVTSPLFIFYANETRSYAMLFFVSVIITALFVKPKRTAWDFRVLLISCVAASLTHYFGLIYAGVILVYMLVENVRERNKFIAVAVTGITGLIWPAYHMLFGTILDRLGGNFWVRSEGVLDTLCLAFSSHFPIIWQSLNWPGMERALAVMLVLSGPVAFLIFEAGKKSERDGDSSRTTLYRSLYAVAGTVAVAAGLDKLWPISTERNFIVILPAVGWGVASFIFILGKHFPRAGKIAILVVLFLGTSRLCLSYGRITRKAMLFENWKDATAYMVKNSDQYHLYGLCHPGQWCGRLQDNYYLLKMSNRSMPSIDVTEKQSALKTPALLLFEHFSGEELGRVLEIISASHEVEVKRFSESGGVLVVNDRRS